MGRRAFLAYTAGLLGAVAGAAYLLAQKKQQRPIRIIEESPDFLKGHLLRQPGAFDHYPRGTTTHTDVAIVGGGMAGLAAGRWLSRKGHTRYTLLEMEAQTGGNASGSAMLGLKYPLGAHYLTMPNAANTTLLEFLHECGMVRAMENGRPLYHEEYMVHAPAEQCYYHGKWHKGLVPLAYFSPDEKKEFALFTQLIETYAQEPLLDIPFQAAALTPGLLALDQVDFLSFLRQKGIQSADVLAYADYCCRDDFGGGVEQVSALAGLHYFCSRRAAVANAGEVDFLSWPNGNAFMAGQLLGQNKGQIRTGAMVMEVSGQQGAFEVLYLEGGKIHTLTAAQVLLDTPHFITERMVSCPALQRIPQHLQVYYPWLVASIVLDNTSGRYTDAFYWDNVEYGAASLGFINSTHQQLSFKKNKMVLTYYHAFKGDAALERRKLFGQDKKQLAALALEALEKLYPGTGRDVEAVSVCRRGHGMICPVPGMFTYLHAHNAMETGVPGLYRIHTDVSGYSVFEEAFANGNRGAEYALQYLKT